MNKVGIDITSISRFLNKNDEFAKRILSSEEFKEYQTINNKSKYLATRWAIKEAIFKADNTFNTFSNINIKKDHKYHFKNFDISTSSEGDLVIAMAIKFKEK
ncbi:4'-phosphopantetheinyl transferase superfamily protein [Mycoplasma zalophi]|uniref:4'-phosphopantetheinyl transferase superfamily protein n=1 Tax=Mycoplasma zalophi TaxID=191287 RepID=A0ABS6DQ46_9MOLU|nr:4'-phosphopantetheinyl transferase superfamily protein [Mycoplasma zalophi]MBU4690747.1 4'-phosphopantetheinyl transferase superfamily protein [Mycoplasma zalophi]MBU4692437.1 4'-phosphopantetheinyl transferase superfamily protein [Mycoplasma zalophi]